MGIVVTVGVQKSASAQLVILDVGHGNTTLIHENAATLVVDAANKSHVLEYLRERSISAIDLVVISHADQDHIGGLIGILVAGIRVKEVRLNTDSLKPSKIWNDLVIALEDARRAGELSFYVGVTVGRLEVRGFVRCEVHVVAPNPGLAAIGPGGQDRRGRRITSNSISACIRIVFDKKAVAFLAGDIDGIALDELVESAVDPTARVLVFPHHGGLPGAADPTQFADRLLAAVRPEVVVFSIGRDKHSNPNPDIVAAVKNYNSSTYIACTQLSRSCSKELSSDASKGFSKIFSAGALTRKCCAGSIVIDLQTADLDPKVKVAHVKFVVNSVASPLCR